MFVQKIQMSIVLTILATAIHVSEASMQELDSIGSMSEITVTAPRYEYQDEAWLGMVEGVVVEATRPARGKSEAITGEESNMLVTEDISSEDMESASIHSINSGYMLILLTLTLVTLSFIFMSFREHLAAREVKHGRKER